MNKFIKLSALFAVMAIAFSSFAQDNVPPPPPPPPPPPAQKEMTKEIVIRKKGDKVEKMTIVVDGDKVTINGKPADEFENKDVKIINRDMARADMDRVKAFRRMPPMITPHGGPDRAAFLGVMTEKAEGGVKITGITKESAAEKAGLKKDDIITKVGSTAVTAPAELVKAIHAYHPDDKVEITYKRNGTESKVPVTLGANKARTFAFNFDNEDFDFEVPEPPMPPMGNFNFNWNHKPRIGLQIQDVEEGKGVEVKDVDDESPASKAGLKEGDVITQVNGKDVEGVETVREQVAGLKEGETVKFSYKRDGKTSAVDVKIPKRLKTANL